MELSQKQQQFNAAMSLYTSRKRYRLFGGVVACTNIALQLVLVQRLWHHTIGFLWQLPVFIAAFLLTDFINGLVHMVMDSTDRYECAAGPLIANFHLHHKIPLYKNNSLPVVYFMETGSKVWMAGYLALVLLLSAVPGVNPVLLHLLVYVGILSSVAEVSHYLCHNSNAKLPRLLASTGLLLSKRHHGRHHLQDNCNYAFLNGMSDPLLNVMARFLSRGYKQTTDLHYARYDVESR